MLGLSGHASVGYSLPSLPLRAPARGWAPRMVTPSVPDYDVGLWEERDMPTFDYQLDYYSDLLEGMEKCQQENERVLPLLNQLSKFDFFSYFAVDLLSSCGYMPTNEEPCGLDACEIDPAEEVPEAMVARDDDEYEFELDSYGRWDQPSDFTEYYDLRVQKEKNTGYDGRRVWRFIHQKISFQREVEDKENGWKRDFNRAISGMHAAVDAQIINDIGVTDEGLDEYRRRLRDEPGAITNLYFAYMLTLCAVLEMQERLNSCNYLGEGDRIRPIMQELTSAALLNDPAVRCHTASAWRSPQPLPQPQPLPGPARPGPASPRPRIPARLRRVPCAPTAQQRRTSSAAPAQHLGGLGVPPCAHLAPTLRPPCVPPCAHLASHLAPTSRCAVSCAGAARRSEPQGACRRARRVCVEGAATHARPSPGHELCAPPGAKVGPRPACRSRHRLPIPAAASPLPFLRLPCTSAAHPLHLRRFSLGVRHSTSPRSPAPLHARSCPLCVRQACSATCVGCTARS